LRRRAESSRPRASSSTVTFWTRASATWPSSPTRMGTRSCSTEGTRLVIDVQRTDFVAVPTRDRDRAAAFYGETLGLTKDPNSTETWIEFETGNTTLAFVSPESLGAPFVPLPIGSIVFRAPDVPEAKAKLEAAAVEFIGESWDSGVCHGAVFNDPDGNGLALHHRYAPYPDGSTP